MRSKTQFAQLIAGFTATQVIACQDPTQVQVELSTDALCEDVRNTSITLASSENLEQALPDTSTSQCDPKSGRIGSLTVIPSQEDRAGFSVRVVTGLGKSADQCVADGYVGGCIVARRALHFIPHQTMHLPIQMEVRCTDVPCGATETCKHGHCVDDTITDVNSCASASGCDLSVGGAAGTGGSTALATAGPGGTGGASAAGGTKGEGGAATMGGSSSTSIGGALGSGGTPNLGGASASVATLATGGNLFTGGTSATGGTLATGGVAGIGGDVATGGVVGIGGDFATGGVVGIGGDIATGGVVGVGGDTLPMSTGGDPTGGSGAVASTLSTGGLTASGGSATGGTPSYCGDGTLNAYQGEFCDTSSESPSCNADCSPAICGDGIINGSASETCDGSTASVHCTPKCQLSVCGDSYIDPLTGEQCESGMDGCVSCTQDVSGRTDAIRVLARRGSELILNTLNIDVQIANSGPSVPLNGLKLRYYYTPDSSDAQSASCNFLDAGCSKATFSVGQLRKTCSNAKTYVEVAIHASGNLDTGSKLTVQGSVTGGLLSLYDYGNDYSRPSSLLLYQDEPSIALYRDGRLAWGTPPCGCGNGAIDPGEACDNGGESVYCNGDCTLARCGDGKVNSSAGETCDEGQPSLTCDPECHATGLVGSAASALIQWIDPSWAKGVLLAPHVARLRDRSPLGNDLNQADPGKQPYWFANAFGTRPGVYFNGLNHEMTATTPVSNNGTGSVLVVHRVAPVGSVATLLGNGWSGNGGGFSIRTRPQLDGLGIAFGSSDAYSTELWTLGASSGNGPPTPRATYWAWDPPDFVWASGSTGGWLSDPGTYVSANALLTYGGVTAQEPFTGWIGEVLLFNRSLSTVERDSLLAYLRAKWSVQ